MNNDDIHNERKLLLRYACERTVRSCFVRANGSVVRQIARKAEAAALRVMTAEAKRRARK